MRVLALANLFLVLVLVLVGLYGRGRLVRLLGGLGRGDLVVGRLDIAKSGCEGASVQAQCAQRGRGCVRGMAEAGAGSNARCAVNEWVSGAVRKAGERNCMDAAERCLTR
jgi:hypothetical protein